MGFCVQQLMTKQQYIEYLVATPSHYTCTHLANHLEGEAATSHDSISDYLRREKLTPRRLWEVVQPLLHDSPDSYLIVDDSVQNKQYSQKIELVKLQYSGAEGGLVRGIGVVNLLHTSGEEGDFFPIDFRIYAPDCDGKTKNEHFLEMLIRAKSDKRLQANTVLFDSWYASVDNLKVIHRLGMVFVSTLKSNRLVSTSKEQYQASKEQNKDKKQAKNKGYVHLDTLEWNSDTLRHGQLIKLQEMPFLVRLFKILYFKMVATNGDIDWVITNRALDQDNPDDQTTRRSNYETIKLRTALPRLGSLRTTLLGSLRTTLLGSLRTTFKTRTPCVGRSSSCIGNSSNSWGPRNASAAKDVPNATI